MVFEKSENSVKFKSRSLATLDTVPNSAHAVESSLSRTAKLSEFRAEAELVL